MPQTSFRYTVHVFQTFVISVFRNGYMAAISTPCINCLNGFGTSLSWDRFHVIRTNTFTPNSSILSNLLLKGVSTSRSHHHMQFISRSMQCWIQSNSTSWVWQFYARKDNGQKYQLSTQRSRIPLYRYIRKTPSTCRLWKNISIHCLLS
jgi:hypothetical protein